MPTTLKLSLNAKKLLRNTRLARFRFLDEVGARQTLAAFRSAYPRVASIWKSQESRPALVPSAIRHYIPKGGSVHRRRGVEFIGRRIVTGPAILRIFDADQNLLWRYSSAEIKVRVEVYNRKGKFLTSIVPGSYLSQ